MANPTPFTPEEVSQILEAFFAAVGTRQYIGARYVPIFGRRGEESIIWDNSKPYEPLTIVLYQGNSFTSRQYVPEGVSITNEEFWAETGNYNAQIEQYRRETAEARQAAADAQMSADNAQLSADNAQLSADNAQSTADNGVNLAKRANPLSKVITPTKVFTVEAPANMFVQGMTTDGINLYCAFASGGQLKIIVYDTSGNKIAESPIISGGHGNSLTLYNGYIYAPILFTPTGTTYNNRQIAKIDPTTWDISVFTVNAPCDSAYINSDMFVYTTYPNQQLMIDTPKDGIFSPFAKVQLLKSPSPIQDIDFINNLLFICHGITGHNPFNYINVYSLFGTFMGSLAIELGNAELEGITHISDTVYISVRDGVTNNLIVYTINVANLFSSYGVDSFNLTRTWPDIAHLFIHKDNLFTTLQNHANFVDKIKFNSKEITALRGEGSNQIEGKFRVGFADVPCYYDRSTDGIVVAGDYLNAGKNAHFSVFARYIFNSDHTEATLTTFYAFKSKGNTTSLFGSYATYLADEDISDVLMPIYIDCMSVSGVYYGNGYKI